MFNFTFDLDFDYDEAYNNFFQTYKNEYDWGWIHEPTLRGFVVRNLITAKQYREIVGEPYEQTEESVKA